MDTFSYPKKGSNIPPDRADRPASMEGEEDYDEEQKYGEEGEEGDGYGNEEAQSYYDENGNRVEPEEGDGQ